MPRVFFWAGLLEGLAQDLGLHDLAAEQAFELVDTILEFADAADRDDLLVRPDRLVPALCHAPSPLKEEAGRDALQPGDGRERHAGLHGLLDQPGLFLRSVTPPAVDAGDDLNALDGLRHRRRPRLESRPSGLCRLSGRIGGRSNPLPADRRLTEGESFDPKIVTGTKPAGILLDELHVIAEAPDADRFIGQIRGGLISQPEGFLITITTHPVAEDALRGLPEINPGGLGRPGSARSRHRLLGWDRAGSAGDR